MQFVRADEMCTLCGFLWHRLRFGWRRRRKFRLAKFVGPSRNWFRVYSEHALFDGNNYSLIAEDVPRVKAGSKPDWGNGYVGVKGRQKD